MKPQSNPEQIPNTFYNGLPKLIPTNLSLIFVIWSWKLQKSIPNTFPNTEFRTLPGLTKSSKGLHHMDPQSNSEQIPNTLAGQGRGRHHG